MTAHGLSDLLLRVRRLEEAAVEHRVLLRRCVERLAAANVVAGPDKMTSELLDDLSNSLRTWGWDR